MRKIQIYLLSLLIATILAGCAPDVLVPQERYFWPPPPLPPRIEWVGAYSSQLDLKMTTVRRIKEFIAGQDIPLSLKKPVEVRADPVSDKVYVADTEIGGVYVFDLKNSELRKLSISGSRFSEQIVPVGLALDGDMNLYVLEARLRKILVFNRSEKYVRSIDLADICKRPVAIAVDKSRGRLYVSDVQLDKIFALDPAGNRLFDFGRPGSGDGTFNKPVGIAVTSKGDIIVADSFNARIQIFSESGAFRLAFGTRGEGAGNFQLIKSVAVDPDDNIYVVDGRSSSISIFNQEGELLLSLGSFYAVSSSGKRAPGGFSLPMGIDIDNLGRIFVVDQLNARIQVFQYLSDKPSPAKSPETRQVK